jgi:hypothetical protein
MKPFELYCRIAVMGALFALLVYAVARDVTEQGECHALGGEKVIKHVCYKLTPVTK